MHLKIKTLKITLQRDLQTFSNCKGICGTVVSKRNSRMIIRKDGYKSRVNSSSQVRDMCISSQVTLYSIMITRESEVLTPSARPTQGVCKQITSEFHSLISM